MGWSEIPEDILLSITGYLPTVIDYLNLSHVCKPWRSIALSPHNLAVPSQPPFLMLSESKGKASEEHLRGFVEFKKGTTKVYNLYLPEIHQNRCIGSTANWLILINLDLQIYIFNPFTKHQIQFPSQSTLPDQYEDSDDDDAYTKEELRDLFISKAILSSSNSDDNMVAMVVYAPQRKLAIARPGDQSWTPIPTETRARVDDAIFFRGQFCSIHRRGNVTACHIDSSPPNAVAMIRDFKDRYNVGKYYLVEWLGNLLLVTRNFTCYDEEPFYETKRFEVYMYDFDSNEWEEVRSLGQHSLFLGFNSSVSMLISDYSPFKKNCIYFTDNNTMGYCGNEAEGGHDMGVFDLDDQTIKPHYDGISTSFHSPPLWIIPKFVCQ